MEWMVLDQFFPYGGIDGVVEEPVYGEEVDVLREALGVGYTEEVLFSRVVSTRGRATDWFVLGDVVCRRLGLDEERSDVLRLFQDKLFIAGSVDWSSYTDEFESLRREAIETHQWKVHRSDDWAALIDAQGRALLVARTGAFRHWRKAIEQLVPRQPKSRSAKTPLNRVSAAWCALRVLHRHFIHGHEGKLTMGALMKSESLVADVYKHRLKMGRYSGSGRIIRMRKYRAPLHRAFWERCFGMMESGQGVPFVVRHVHKHPSTRWVAVSVDDAEWLLGCSWWPEWVGRGPVRFERFRRGEKHAGKMWH